jgi:Mn2+/Fe2+ NRAMP family transporter
VVNGLFLPVLLVFVTKLAGSWRIMGEHRNRGLPLVVAWVTTVVLAGLAAWLVAVSVVLPVFGVRAG